MLISPSRTEISMAWRVPITLDISIISISRVVVWSIMIPAVVILRLRDMRGLTGWAMSGLMLMRTGLRARRKLWSTVHSTRMVIIV
jgi:hypothetical protein